MSQRHKKSAAVGEQQSLWPGEAFTYSLPDLDGDAVRPRDLSAGGGLGLRFSLRRFKEVGVHPCGLRSTGASGLSSGQAVVSFAVGRL